MRRIEALRGDELKIYLKNKKISSLEKIQNNKKNIEGEKLSKDLNQNQLASRYPEMAEKLEG